MSEMVQISRQDNIETLLRTFSKYQAKIVDLNKECKSISLFFSGNEKMRKVRKVGILRILRISFLFYVEAGRWTIFLVKEKSGRMSVQMSVQMSV